MFSKLRLYWERSPDTAAGRSCSHNGRIAELWIDGKSWNLCIQSLTRIQPDERWDELIDAVNSLRPLASEALLALFKQSMTSQLEDAFGKVLEHQSKRGR